MQGNPQEFTVDCDCHAHKLHVQKFPDEDIVYLSKFYWSCQDGRPSFVSRLKTAYEVLFKHHRVNLDDVILTNENAKKLGTFLLSITQPKTKNTFIGQK